MILIVEDEFLINWTIAEDLRSQGCPAISAFTADEAIEVLQSRFDIEVVFTDIDMPGSMNGLKLDDPGSLAPDPGDRHQREGRPDRVTEAGLVPRQGGRTAQGRKSGPRSLSPPADR